MRHDLDAFRKLVPYLQTRAFCAMAEANNAAL
jgi:hypothetical protein